MKRLHDKEITEAFAMYQPIQVRWDLLPHVYQLVAHNVVTLDMNPTFIGIAKTFKAARRTHDYADLKVYKINNSTGKKTLEYVNPDYK